MLTDGEIKTAILVMLAFFNLAGREFGHHRNMAVCAGLIVMMYYLFLFGWLVTAAVIFWGHAYPKGHCDNEFGRYMWAALIIGFVSVPIGLFFSVMRGDKNEEQVIKIGRRETEMSTQ